MEIDTRFPDSKKLPAYRQNPYAPISVFMNMILIIQVLLWNTNNWMEFSSDSYVVIEPNFLGAPIAKECGVKCTIIKDKTQIANVDAVLFEGIPDGSHVWDWVRVPVLMPQKRPGQLWINFGYQHSKYYPLLAQPLYLDHFDLNMTFDQSSGLTRVPISQHCNWGIDREDWTSELKKPPPPKTQGNPHPYLKRQKNLQYFGQTTAKREVEQHG